MNADGKLAARVVIAGAGFAGLLAASAVAPYFETVTILDKDELPAVPRHRRGVAQDLQVHLLLKGGELALERLMPGVRCAFIAAGAVEIRQNQDVSLWEHDGWHPERDLGYSHLLMSRPAYEHVVRRRVELIGNATIHDRTSIDSLHVECGRLTGLHVTGPSGSRLERGDLIVLAMGRGGQFARHLADAGLPAVPMTELGIDVNYVSARFAKPDRYKGEARFIGCIPRPPDVRYGLVCPIENDEWLITLCGRFGRKPPTDLDGFRDYAAALPIPDIAERLHGAVPIGPLRAYRIGSAVWRHFDRYDGLPQRMIPIGDCVSSFNPTFGQGMSVAAGHAVALSDALAARHAGSRRLDGLADDYLPRVMECSAQAWRLAAIVDMEYPQSRGRRPPDFGRIVDGMAAMRRAAGCHVEVQRLRFEIGNMIKPDSAARRGATARLIAAELLRRP